MYLMGRMGASGRRPAFTTPVSCRAVGRLEVPCRVVWEPAVCRALETPSATAALTFRTQERNFSLKLIAVSSDAFGL